ncbi:hypothetical protein BFU36_13370 [Sulfolobus sp. A20]|nr:hypothetical protein BFU36_13370 [Sulfolobus sp. A20]TRM74223.1 hypothetical protein DJ532_13380 [Sulfolobus sp. A20-N-F8]TRM74958.1 hypothetical protein DJ523_03800 [Sulfolobus sp. E5]TRM82134.1 hypothetical protein DJ531_09920 [Sulfolobus sp. A20-N-F6]TRM82222.1 hypothetical protein DJ524_01360 [Sulfolobus sp. D5]TRM87066.1 hypothetical protein DJ529_09610 [Sulfolobus sp. C3]TRM94412.1 hypothetical protein DJ526_02715 [Sulfolobus sp. A20-N-G8]TRM97474.1 hypothetical protein DMP16_02500 
MEKGVACIIRAKNSKSKVLPKEEYIKDGLLKMIFTNLAELYCVYNNPYKINEMKTFLKLTGNILPSNPAI